MCCCYLRACDGTARACQGQCAYTPPGRGNMVRLNSLCTDLAAATSPAMQACAPCGSALAVPSLQVLVVGGDGANNEAAPRARSLPRTPPRLQETLLIAAARRGCASFAAVVLRKLVTSEPPPCPTQSAVDGTAGVRASDVTVLM